jgi:putative transposase
VSDERCKWPNTLSCGLAGKGRYDRNTVGRESTIIEGPADPPSAEELAAARELVRQPRAQGVALTGPGGLLKALTKTVLETALEEELAEHLGYDNHDPAGRNRGNSRNGKSARTVLTDSGEVAIEVPRDRDGSFAPVIVAKRQRRLFSIDEIVVSLYARGLTTGDIAAHFGQIYDAQVFQGHHLPDHRPGAGEDASLDQPAVGAGAGF